jgi:hypothetical protein
MGETQLVYQGDLAGLAESRLLSQDADKPRIVAFVRALGAGAQLLEDIAFSVLTSTLDICSDHRLDQWGDLVGEPRGGLDDTQYRVFIKARILANRSAGHLDEIIRVAQLVTAPSVVTSEELAPKHVTLWIARDNEMDRRLRGRVVRLLRSIKPAGTFLEMTEVLPGYFGFDGDTNALGFNQGELSRLL